MTPPAEPTPNELSIGVRLATFLSDRRDQIISDCMASIQRDEKVPTSDTLNPSQLRDHLPQLLDKLAQVLSDAFNQELEQQAAWTAATHGHIRWKEGYDISELLREFSHLRSSLIRHLIEFQELNPESRGASWLFATTVLHRFLDDSIRNSVEQYHATAKLFQRKEPPR
jgi:hypothetical protein